MSSKEYKETYVTPPTFRKDDKEQNNDWTGFFIEIAAAIALVIFISLMV